MFAEGSVEEVEEISSTKAQSGRTLHKFAGTRERLLVLHKHPCGHVCFAVVLRVDGEKRQAVTPRTWSSYFLAFFLFFPAYRWVFFPSLPSVGEGESRH